MLPEGEKKLTDSKKKHKMGVLHVEPHIPEPYRTGNTIVANCYEKREEISKGLIAICTCVDYKTKKGQLVSGYVLSIKYEQTAERLPNTSDLLNMTLKEVEYWCSSEIEREEPAFVKNMARPVYQRKFKEAHKIHRTKLKLTINPILRKIQFWTNEPYVIASKFNNGEFVSYTIQRVKYSKYPEPSRREVYNFEVKNPILKTIKHIFGVK